VGGCGGAVSPKFGARAFARATESWAPCAALRWGRRRLSKPDAFSRTDTLVWLTKEITAFEERSALCDSNLRVGFGSAEFG
jgi:hypothetical protein